MEKGVFGGELFVVKEFSEDNAGDIAGWVDVRKVASPDGDRVKASVAYAQISEQGARYAYEEINRPPDSHDVPHPEGFGPSVEIAASTSLPATRSKLMTHVGHSPDRESQYAIHQFGTSFRTEDQPTSGKGEWLLGEAEILQSLKRQLHLHGAEGMYPIMYYSMALSADGELQLADRSMRTLTEIEQVLAEHRLRQLHMLESEDTATQRMLQRLDEVGVAVAVDNFVASRRVAAIFERDIEALMEGTCHSSAHLFLPVGQGEAGRVWPYMDPMEEDEDRSFGNEREDLRLGIPGTALFEVGREIQELSYRIRNAYIMMSRLAMLSVRETTRG
jgi:hypothetical protein